MYQEERIYKILKLLREKKSLSNQEIMEKFNISRDTARRDILKLVDEGVAVRTHNVVNLSNL
ncbi:DeoR family transcriptional regulator [Clostridium carnis]|uniref:DeoR family transcriptional regulator n=1 Tax=Clostridium carnis TaxID=1530 RepID=A0ABY6SWB7_9CLOT|nr:DeoR family transcriptional regulator [Clostridium carnis]VDG72928.1 DeoR family transcriptional regulator [Clostridium carnis]